MPRYFSDIADGLVTKDDEGNEYPDAPAARDAAIQTLPDVARDEIGRGDRRRVTVLVRDGVGQALFTASLALSATWLVDTA